jgi:hypothetical protein
MCEIEQSLVATEISGEWREGETANVRRPVA